MDDASGQPQPGDDRLVDYLLGNLSEQDAEQLDELSVADDEFAWRLRAVENDLVDAYVRGELAEPVRERFESAYLASPRRRAKVVFARALQDLGTRAADGSEAAVASSATPDAPSPAGAERAGFTWPLREWALAAAALVAVAGAGYLMLENRRLEDEANRARSATADIERAVADLRSELERERSAAEMIRQELERLQASLPSVPAVRLPSLRAFDLRPMRRGVEAIPNLTIPAGVDRVPIRLHLESDDFPQYSVELKNPGTGETVWQSERLAPRGPGGGRYVDVDVPGSILTPRTWSMELSGHSPGGSEFMTSYAFRVERPAGR